MGNENIKNNTETLTKYGNLAMNYLHKLLEITQPFFTEASGKPPVVSEDMIHYKWIETMLPLIANSDCPDAEVMYVALKSNRNSRFLVRLSIANEIITLLSMVRSLSDIEEDIDWAKQYLEGIKPLLDKKVMNKAPETLSLPRDTRFNGKKEFEQWIKQKSSVFKQDYQQLNGVINAIHSFTNEAEKHCGTLYDKIPDTDGGGIRANSRLLDYMGKDDCKTIDELQELLNLRQSIIEFTGDEVWRPTLIKSNLEQHYKVACINSKPLLAVANNYDLVYVLLRLLTDSPKDSGADDK